MYSPSQYFNAHVLASVLYTNPTLHLHSYIDPYIWWLCVPYVPKTIEAVVLRRFVIKRWGELGRSESPVIHDFQGGREFSSDWTEPETVYRGKKH